MLEDAKSLRRWLSVSDQQRFEEYLGSVHEIEGRIKRAGKERDPGAWKPTLASPDAFAGLRDVARDRSPARSGTLYGTELPPERLRAALEDVREVWVLEGAEAEPLGAPRGQAGERVKKDVLADFHSEREERTRGARLSLFVRN